jgi:hypothetical protein
MKSYFRTTRTNIYYWNVHNNVLLSILRLAVILVHANCHQHVHIAMGVPVAIFGLHFHGQGDVYAH